LPYSVIKNNPPSAEANRGSRGPSAKVSACGRHSGRGPKNRITAREHHEASVPPARVLNGVGADEPAVAIPEDVDRAKDAIPVVSVEDVGTAVVQENAGFAVLL